MKNRNVVWIVVCAAAVLLIYSIDLFKLNYQMTSWQDFGNPPMKVDHINYFVADTPNIIGYTDHTLGREVTCFEAVAYVKTDIQETYRCCDAEGTISCLEGDFSSDIPPVDEECTASLRTIFGVPATLDGAKEYLAYGSCPDIRFGELTVVRLDNNGQIQWKYVKVSQLQILTSALRCVVGPLLLLLVIWLVYSIMQARRAEPVRRF